MDNDGGGLGCGLKEPDEGCGVSGAMFGVPVAEGTLGIEFEAVSAEAAASTAGIAGVVAAGAAGVAAAS